MILWKHLEWRKGLLSALEGFDLANPSETAMSLDAVLVPLIELEQGCSPRQAAVLETLRLLIGSVADLCRWFGRTLVADPLAGTYRDSAVAKAAIVSTKLKDSEFTQFASGASTLAETIALGASAQQVDEAVSRLKQLAVPVFLVDFHNARRKRRVNLETATEGEGTLEDVQSDNGPFVVKVMLEIDRKPWINPQVLRAETLYDVSAQVAVSTWPPKADTLVIDTISTLDPAAYSITDLRISRGTDLETRVTGHASFHTAQSLLSEPIRILARATFLSSSDNRVSINATVIGYHELRLRVMDPKSVPILAKYRALDERILAILSQIDTECPGIDPDHREDFLSALSAVANYAGICAQQALYREADNVLESEFRQDLLRHMRTLLGQEVLEGSTQAGGPTDVQYRSITIELKVERRVADREKMVAQYVDQPTQYSAGIGAQLSILCILDLTEKVNPPASPTNNLSVRTPQLHGFGPGAAPFPTKVAVVVIDGKLRRPSDYSR